MNETILERQISNVPSVIINATAPPWGGIGRHGRSSLRSSRGTRGGSGSTRSGNSSRRSPP
ncbi:hypothetical protein [Methanoculleus chikugoensis]|uniref:hypothetical protein n=1 Tax=Methanoculleus chikugoensis TaxID=118126 RepID=UPI001FB31A6C|nr:hypothetical protein [Methanoculleus chikugoensis]